MDYSKIRVLQSQNRLTAEEMGEILGITGAGFTKMMNNRTCSVLYLEKIAEFFKKQISYFFEQEENYADEPTQKYTIKKIECQECISKQKEIDALKAAIEAKDELLELYRDKKKAAGWK